MTNNMAGESRRPGRIEVVCGSMFSGKTEELIRRMRRAKFAKQNVEIFKPAIDTRYSEENGGAVWLDRVELDIKSTIDENTDANVWRGYSRFSAGFNDWRFAAVGGITGGNALVD